MDICIIAGYYYNSKDGIGRYAYNLRKNIKKLKENNINLKIILKENNLLKIQNTKNWKALIPSSLKSYLTRFYTELYYFSQFIYNRFLLTSELTNIDAQVYHAISPSECVALMKLKKRPLITTFHDVIPLIFKPRYLLERYYFKYYCNLAKKSDVVIANSNNTKNDLVKFFNISKDKIKVIYPGTNTNKFYPKKIRRKGKIKNILYLGSLEKRKGVYEVLYAFDKLLKIRRDIRLLIAGGGGEFYKLRKEIERLKIKKFVKLLGFVNEKNLINCYHRSDLFVYPSKYEGFGFTPLEAMACAVPVITSNCSSIPEILGNAALKINPYDINEICEKMNNVLSDLKLQDRMKKRGLKQVQKFSWKKCAKETSKLYKSLI